ncbi:MAG TPA: hypothetical protein VGO81_07880 [Solirubrobacteraceae bacterium]|jgi:hypothetical protein|nr:hypothetical protein [Solirubrobacteraceae bacterium]HEV7883473.1 hypothetical protein [Solirubrobacteraceae bacterium]
MAELELTRTAEDRRLFALEGVGTLRLEGWGSPRATAETGVRSWHFARRGYWRRGIDATDAFGGMAGTFEPARKRRGGALHWVDDDLVLRPASMWRERYALADGDRELVVLDSKDWGKRPLRVTVEDLDEIDPGLLLFATFVVRGLTVETGAAAAAAAGATSA